MIPIVKKLGLGKVLYHLFFRPRNWLAREVEDWRLPNEKTRVMIEGRPFVVPNPRRNRIGRALCTQGVWESEVTQKVMEVVKPGMKVVDVGADVGYYSILFSRLVGVGGRVFSFEPIDEARSVLEENMVLNAARNISVYDFALGCQAATMILERPFELSRLKPGKLLKGDRDIDVQVRVFDELDGFPRIDFVKMDVEGAEYDVLVGMREMIRRDHPILLIEVHAVLLPIFGQSVVSLRRFLREMGYQEEVVGENNKDAETFFILCR